MPWAYVAMAGVVAAAALGLQVALRRQERRSPRQHREGAGRGESGEAEARALAGSGLGEVLDRLGFARQESGRFQRGDVSIRAQVRREKGSGRPRVYAWDVCVDDGRPMATFERDFVARARRGAQGLRAFDARVEAREGDTTVKRDAAPTDCARFERLVERHAAALVAVTYDAVELFNHREARLHLCVRAPDELARPDALLAVIDLARTLHADARGENPAANREPARTR